MTSHPPTPGFDGYESNDWDGLRSYERACTAEEAELLDAHRAAALAEEQAELTALAEAERDQWFDKLRTELAEMRANTDRHSETHRSPAQAGAQPNKKPLTARSAFDSV